MIFLFDVERLIVKYNLFLYNTATHIFSLQPERRQADIKF